jgi:hypothetical protein
MLLHKLHAGVVQSLRFRTMILPDTGHSLKQVHPYLSTVTVSPTFRSGTPPNRSIAGCSSAHKCPLKSCRPFLAQDVLTNLMFFEVYIHPQFLIVHQRAASYGWGQAIWIIVNVKFFAATYIFTNTYSRFRLTQRMLRLKNGIGIS